MSTRVLPEPAPATMSSGPPSWTTAWRCGPLSPASIRSSSRPAGPGRGALEGRGSGQGLLRPGEGFLDAAHDDITVSRTGDAPAGAGNAAPHPSQRTVVAPSRRAVADSPTCSPRSAFSTVTGIRCPSPLAEHTPQQTPRARRAPGRFSVSGLRRPPLPPKDIPMSTTSPPPPPPSRRRPRGPDRRAAHRDRRLRRRDHRARAAPAGHLQRDRRPPRGLRRHPAVPRPGSSRCWPGSAPPSAPTAPRSA